MRFLADTHAPSVVGVLRQLRARRLVSEFNETVPSVVHRREPRPRKVGLGLRPRGEHDDAARRVRDPRDLVGLVVGAGLDEVVCAVAGVVLVEIRPVGDLVQLPVLVERQAPAGDGVVRAIQLAALVVV